MKITSVRKPPPSGPAREALREKGQFWTPCWVAEAMVSYVLAGSASRLFDPAVGAGAFFQAAKLSESLKRKPIRFLGTEIHPEALMEALESGLTKADLREVEIRDFVLDPPPGRFAAIVANPPYIRHHRLSAETKERLKLFCRTLLGFQIDARAGYHIYFLLRALERLALNGRLAFIMPADTCEGVFARGLWAWITNRYKLDAVITFTPDASPFPGVDTNALILMIRNANPSKTLAWAHCAKEGRKELVLWVRAGFKGAPTYLSVHRRHIAEAVETGLSRPPSQSAQQGLRLGDLASAMRGIATGANGFFFLNGKEALELGIPDEYLVPAIGRTRDVKGDLLTASDLQELDKKRRPTRLLSLGNVAIKTLPQRLQHYIERGEKMGLPQRPLIASRRPWYRMEVRAVPPFLFAYLGRRNARFVYNPAGVVPLTGFLCVYPRENSPEFRQKLWKVLNHPETLANLTMVGKSYGGGAIKVEPRALEALPLPKSALAEAGLQAGYWHEQYALPL